jgi:hypothetical protein
LIYFSTFLSKKHYLFDGLLSFFLFFGLWMFSYFLTNFNFQKCFFFKRKTEV